MSARFYKIFAFVAVIHMVVFNLIWVGFSTPLSRLPAAFIYQGPLPEEDMDQDTQEVGPKDNLGDQFVLHQKGSDLNPWIKLRQPDKDSPYVHLGF